MDQLSIRDLIFSGRHGVHPEEHEEPRQFGVSLTIWADLNAAAESDNLDDTINWAQIRKTIKQIVEEESFKLIEALTLRIVRRLLEIEKVQRVRVTVDKLEAWPVGVPSITLERSRS